MIPLLFHLGTDDAPRLAALHARAYDAPWSEAAFRETLALKSSLGFGLEIDETLLAFSLVQIAADAADLLQIATDPDHLRQGLARQIFTAMETRLTLDGVTRLMLEVAADNQPAIAFYASVGFTEDGRRPHYYAAGRLKPVDAILMSKPL